MKKLQNGFNRMGKDLGTVSRGMVKGLSNPKAIGGAAAGAIGLGAMYKGYSHMTAESDSFPASSIDTEGTKGDPSIGMPIDEGEGEGQLIEKNWGDLSMDNPFFRSGGGAGSSSAGLGEAAEVAEIAAI